MNEYKRLKHDKTIEYREGLFRQEIVRHGKKKRVRTRRIKKNPEKVSFGYIGSIEYFCYPYSNDDKIYYRMGKQTGALDKYEIARFMVMYNISRSYLKGGLKRALQGLSQSKLADKIMEAYNTGVKNAFDKVKKEKEKEVKKNRSAKKAE